MFSSFEINLHNLITNACYIFTILLAYSDINGILEDKERIVSIITWLNIWWISRRTCNIDKTHVVGPLYLHQHTPYFCICYTSLWRGIQNRSTICQNSFNKTVFKLQQVCVNIKRLHVQTWHLRFANERTIVFSSITI